MRPAVYTCCLAACVLSACAHARPRVPVALGTAPGAPQDTIAVSYVSGGIKVPSWTNPDVRPYGNLILGDSALALVSERGDVLFTMPLAIVKDARSSVDTRGPSTIDRLLLGVLAGHQRDEILAVQTETPRDADVLVFRMQHENTSQAAAAKILFRVTRLRGSASR